MTDKHKRQVIALFRTIGKDGDMLFQVVDDLRCRGHAVFVNIMQHAILTKQFPVARIRFINGFRQAIRIEQQG